MEHRGHQGEEILLWGIKEGGTQQGWQKGGEGQRRKTVVRRRMMWSKRRKGGFPNLGLYHYPDICENISRDVSLLKFRGYILGPRVVP